jgi:hypothetical protein
VPLFAQGEVFAPDKTWAQDVIDETLAFPKGRHDDWVDTVSSAFIYFEEEQKRDRRDRLQYLSAASPCPPVVADGCADRFADGVPVDRVRLHREEETSSGLAVDAFNPGAAAWTAGTRHVMKGWPA